jgi:hypothetical protein
MRCSLWPGQGPSVSGAQRVQGFGCGQGGLLLREHVAGIGVGLLPDGSILDVPHHGAVPQMVVG